MARRFRDFLYLAPGRKDRQPGLHEIRDGHRLLDWTVLLTRHGYDYGGPIFNVQPRGIQAHPPLVEHLDSSDLLVCATRPPLDDRVEGSRKQVDPSGTDLETRLHSGLRKYFRFCSRVGVTLSDVAQELCSTATETGPASSSVPMGALSIGITARWIVMLSGQSRQETNR
jgi:hypothetical protein